MKKNFFYKMIRPFFSIYFNIFYKPIIVGKENIPKDGCILVANHKSNLDFISMGLVTKRNIHFLAKSTLFKGILRLILNFSGVIPVNRTIKDKSVIPKCIELIKENEIIGIFPEGTFNKTNNLLAPFKIGAVKIAYETKAPIIPIVISKYRRNMKITIEKPIYVLGDNLNVENERLMKYMEKMITENGE